MPNIEIPGIGVVEFPDTMHPAEVGAAAKRLYEQSSAARPVPNTVSPAPYSGAPDHPVEDPGLMDPTNWLPGVRVAQAVPVVGPPLARTLIGTAARMPGVRPTAAVGGALGQAIGRRALGSETFDDLAAKLLATFGKKPPAAASARPAPSPAMQRAWARPVVGREDKIVERVARLAAQKDPAVAASLATAKEAARAEGKTVVSEYTRSLPKRAITAAAKEPVPTMARPGRVPIKVPGKPEASRAANQRGVSGPTIARRGVQQARVADATKRPLAGNVGDMLEQSVALAKHMKQLGFSPAEKEAVWRALRAGG